MYKTAEELEDNFEGGNFHLWEYWHIRKAEMIFLDNLSPTSDARMPKPLPVTAMTPFASNETWQNFEGED
jgi:hypothetical protein